MKKSFNKLEIKVVKSFLKINGRHYSLNPRISEDTSNTNSKTTGKSILATGTEQPTAERKHQSHQKKRICHSVHTTDIVSKAVTVWYSRHCIQGYARQMWMRCEFRNNNRKKAVTLQSMLQNEFERHISSNKNWMKL